MEDDTADKTGFFSVGFTVGLIVGFGYRYFCKYCRGNTDAPIFVERRCFSGSAVFKDVLPGGYECQLT